MPSPRAPSVRLFLDHPLAEGQAVPLTEDQARYLFSVMRLPVAARLLAFDGRSGEWEAEVAEAGRRGGTLRVLGQTRAMVVPPDLWLLFAPIKKARTDFIVEKATEMGCRRILPVITERTRSERVNAGRLRLHAVEAAEQCGGVFVPEVADAQPLARLLDAWEGARALWFCDEALAGGPPGAPGSGAPGPGAPPRAEGPGAVLVGPEGGFTDGERARLGAMAAPVRLGPRVLRADTAAVAALAVWQATNGDWR